MTDSNEPNADGISRRTALKKGVLASSLLAVGVPSLSGQAAADHVEVANGLVAHYPLDGTSGPVEDVSDNGNDGTNNGATRGEVGPDNEAFEFDGTDDDVRVPDATELQPGSSSWTISFWANPNNVSQETAVVSKRKPSSPVPMYMMGFADSAFGPPPTNGKKLAFRYTEDAGDIDRGVSSNGDVIDGDWHHCTAVADKPNDELHLYVDGSEVAVTVDFDQGGWPNITNTDDLFLGQDNAGGRRYDGLLDDVRIYNRVLSDSEIEQLATRLIIVDEDFSQSFVDNNEFRERTIQDGVDTAQPGDTVWVRNANDGAYEEQVVVDKDDLTLTNAPGHSPTIDGDGNSPAVSIDADGVTFNGFTVKNLNELLGVKVEDDHDSVSISNNTIDGIGPTGNFGATGILADEPQSNLEIANNVVKNVEQTGINPTNGIFLDDVGGGGVSDVSIANNEVKMLSSEWGTLAILVSPDATDVTINGNDVSDISAADPADTVTFAQGINVTSPNTTEVDITRNKVENVTSSGKFDPEAIKIDGDASGVTCRRNELLVDISVKNDDSATLDAKCNWWGSEDGPDDNSTSNPDNDGSEVGDIVGPVTFEPWLTGAPSEPGPARCNGRD